jgi:hypothetical protein
MRALLKINLVDFYTPQIVNLSKLCDQLTKLKTLKKPAKIKKLFIHITKAPTNNNTNYTAITDQTELNVINSSLKKNCNDYIFIYQFLIENNFIEKFQQNKKKPTRVLSIAPHHKMDEFSPATADRYGGNIYSRLSFHKSVKSLLYRNTFFKSFLSRNDVSHKILTVFKEKTKLN